MCSPWEVQSTWWDLGHLGSGIHIRGSRMFKLIMSRASVQADSRSLEICWRAAEWFCMAMDAMYEQASPSSGMSFRNYSFAHALCIWCTWTRCFPARPQRCRRGWFSPRVMRIPCARESSWAEHMAGPYAIER